MKKSPYLCSKKYANKSSATSAFFDSAAYSMASLNRLSLTQKTKSLDFPAIFLFGAKSLHFRALFTATRFLSPGLWLTSFNKEIFASVKEIKEFICKIERFCSFLLLKNWDLNLLQRVIWELFCIMWIVIIFFKNVQNMCKTDLFAQGDTLSPSVVSFV